MGADPETGKTALQFMHPVAPGQDDSGWMKPNPADEQPTNEKTTGDERIFSLEEIAKHNTKVSTPLTAVCTLADRAQDDAWLIIENKVYDVTDVLSWHPGGASAILAYVGKATVDATVQVRDSLCAPSLVRADQMAQYKNIHDNCASISLCSVVPSVDFPC